MYNLVNMIERGLKPFYKRDLGVLLERMNISTGNVVILHASLKAFGYLIGGEDTLIGTILERIGDSGTLVMPAQTTHISNPKYWENPSVPQEWEEMIRDSIAPFDPVRTPVAKELGRVAGYFAFYPGVCRSGHPMYSFAACGKEARYVTGNHGMDYGLGGDSPLGKLYGMGTKILLLGTDFESNTSIHLAEYQLRRPDIMESAPVLVHGVKKWIEFKNVDLDVFDDFLDVEELFFKKDSDKTVVSNIGDGSALARVFDMKECVDFCTEYYRNK